MGGLAYRPAESVIRDGDCVMGKSGFPIIWTREKIEKAFSAFVQKNRRLPVAREMKPQCGLPSRKTFHATMGMPFQEYAAQHYPELLSLRNDRHTSLIQKYRHEMREWSLERLVEAEKAFYQKHGRMPESYEYTDSNGLPMYSVFCKLAIEAYENTLAAQFQKLPEQDAEDETVDWDDSDELSMRMDFHV